MLLKLLTPVWELRGAVSWCLHYLVGRMGVCKRQLLSRGEILHLVDD